ncbi:MAG: Rho termination factor N-terminal domain-containing protein, partial [Sphingobacteriales bacterium]|nr:Rho termination factor N-terminal domain-containing protein [Sphingobacteriales bacterium]
MYDILQLNEMLVPELHDIAAEQSVPNYKKLDKQELISKILDIQAIMNSATNKEEGGEKPKRKRIIKAAVVPDAEEVATVPEIIAKENVAEEIKPAKKVEVPVADKRKPVKKAEAPVEEEDEEELQPITDEESTVPAAIASLLQQEDIQQQQPEMQSDNNGPQNPNPKQFQQ